MIAQRSRERGGVRQRPQRQRDRVRPQRHVVHPRDQPGRRADARDASRDHRHRSRSRGERRDLARARARRRPHRLVARARGRRWRAAAPGGSRAAADASARRLVACTIASNATGTLVDVAGRRAARARGRRRGLPRCGALRAARTDRRAGARLRLPGVLGIQGLRAAHGFRVVPPRGDQPPADVSRGLHPRRDAGQARGRHVRVRERRRHGCRRRIPGRFRAQLPRFAAARRPTAASRTEAIRSAMHAIAEYERTLSAALLDEVAGVPGVTVHGVTDRGTSGRARADAVLQRGGSCRVGDRRRTGRARHRRAQRPHVLAPADGATGPAAGRRRSRVARPLQHDGRDRGVRRGAARA